MTRSKRTCRSAENGQSGADSGSSCPQLYRMYRKLSKKPKQQRQRKQLRNREKEWSGREDLNLRPPGPETKKISQVVDFSIHVSGASTVQTHVIPARRSHSFSYGCPGVGALNFIGRSPLRRADLCPVTARPDGTGRDQRESEGIRGRSMRGVV